MARLLKLGGARGWLFAVALGLSWGALGTPAGAFRNVPEGAKAPEFSLPTVDGKTVSLASHAGKALVLVFVRQGQERSAAALSDLAKLDPGLADKSVVLAVVLNPGDGDAAKWAAEAGATYPVLLDNSGEAYGTYGVMVAPSTGVIAPDGTFRGEIGSHTAGYQGDVEHLVKVALGLEAAEEGTASSAQPAKSEERKNAERQLEKARLLVKRKMGDKAVLAAQEAVQADPTYTEAHVVLGEMLLDLSEDRAGEALGHFQKALELEPSDGAAKIGVARVKGIQGDHEGAAEILTAAAKINPKPEKLYYELGRIYERAGQYQKAVDAYRQALERLLK